MNILIIDDSEKIRLSLKQLLLLIPNVNISGEVSSLKEAIESLSLKIPELVILDLKLNDGTGFEVLKYLAGVGKKTTVIVLSNFALKEIKEYCFDLGADYFFDKSKEFEKALAVIKNLAQEI